MTAKLEGSARMLGVVMVYSLALIGALIVLSSLGCGTTETVRTVTQDKPVPYWDPPDNVKELPPEPVYQAGEVEVEEAQAEPTPALQLILQDLTACLGDSELVRHLYAELYRLVTEAPEPAPTGSSGGPVPP